MPRTGVQGLLDDARKTWDIFEQRRFRELGVTATYFPFGAYRRAGAVASSTTFTTRRDTASGLEATVTTRQSTTATALPAWATKFYLMDAANWDGVIPALTFTRASSESMDTPDAAYWTTAAPNKFSLECWVNFTAVNVVQDIMAKYDITTGATAREWRFYLDASGLLNFEVWDESVPAVIGVKTNAALAAGQWYHLVGVYNGGTDNTTFTLYVDGASVAVTSVDSGLFVSMEDLASLVYIGCSMGTTARTNFLGARMAGGTLGPAFTQIGLSAANVKNLFLACEEALSL